ncbi:MAG: HAMP domain-containing histidine kinase [Acidobacteriota bacterium]|nr:MAG: HAMP domain-containing histidine kinase [Acidobacteriota bacterium]
MKKFLKILVHPVTMISLVQVAWTVALIFWILFFIGRYNQVVELAESTGARPQDLVSWAPLVVGILLLVFIFGGTLVLILYLSRQYILNRQMKIFMSFISHELRTPLTSIRLLLETMRDNKLNPEQEAEFIDNMLQDTDRLTRRIGSILSASRLERRLLPMRQEIISLDLLVERFVQGRKTAIESAGHRVIARDLSPAAVIGDPEQLESVLGNLVANAERYSPTGSDITISLSTLGRWAALSVRDEGIGIAWHELRKVFRLFYRGESGGDSIKRGSGLGLYIVKGIVEQHHGKVTARSQGIGKGTTFVVQLPLANGKSE